MSTQFSWKSRERLNMNKEEYVQFAKDNEELFIVAMEDFHPALNSRNKPMEISAQIAEIVYSEIREDIRKSTDSNPITEFQKFDAEIICTLANQVWFGIPESRSCRSHPAFNLVCDLAEGWEV